MLRCIPCSALRGTRFTAHRLKAAREGPDPPKLMGNHRVVSIQRDDEQDGGGYVITAVDTKAGQKDEVLSF